MCPEEWGAKLKVNKNKKFLCQNLTFYFCPHHQSNPEQFALIYYDKNATLFFGPAFKGPATPHHLADDLQLWYCWTRLLGITLWQRGHSTF
jgi:hypothetical protein